MRTNIEALYAHLAPLAEHEQRGVLEALRDRLEVDRLERLAIANGGRAAPTRWATSPTTWFCDSPEEAALECGMSPLEPIPLDGWAIVERRWAVVVPIGDGDGNRDGEEVQFFATETEAKTLAAEVYGPTTPQRPGP